MPAFSSGIFFMAIAAICFCTGTLFIKLTGVRLPPMEILFARAVVGLIYCTLLLKRANAPVFGRTKQGYLLLRGMLGFSALFCTFYAFVHLPLADATVIVMAHPIFVAIFAAIFLKEYLGGRGVLCVLTAITGVLFVAKPSFLFGQLSNLDSFGVLMASLAAVLSGFAIITIRFLSRHEHPLTIIVYPTFLVLALGPLLDGHNWLMPSSREFIYLLAVGLLMNMGQHFMTVAYKQERAAVIAAIGYLEIPLAALYGAMFFQEVPDVWVYVGAALVALGTFALGRDGTPKKQVP